MTKISFRGLLNNKSFNFGRNGNKFHFFDSLQSMPNDVAYYSVSLVKNHYCNFLTIPDVIDKMDNLVYPYQREDMK